jgi:integrase
LSPNTVIKWTVALQAAFERACRDAGKKGIRGVVAAEKLLTENPWKQFTWIEGSERPLRQFDPTELLSILDYFEERWPIVTIAALVTKVFLWSWGRKSEVVGLRWDMLRQVGSEVHFEIVGKWGVVKWFRIPESLYDELLQIRTRNPFVFAAYSDQIREQYRQQNRSRFASRVSRNFSPQHLGDWMYERIKHWSKGQGSGAAYLHVFRKTSLQYARRGEDTNQRVAMDARLGARVMMTSYVRETDEELRQKSNRTFERIASGFPGAVIGRYGFEFPSESISLVDQLRQAVETRNWDTVTQLSVRLKTETSQGQN